MKKKLTFEEMTKAKEKKIKAVSALLKHPGWKYVEEHIEKKIEETGSIRSVDVKGKSDAEIMRQVLARQIKSETLIQFKNYIKNMAQEAHYGRN